MYPIKFEPIYFEKIWGGRGFGPFRKDLPQGNIGESWDVACHPNGTSMIANGAFKGLALDEVIKQEGNRILGTRFDARSFPLLVKLINAMDTLSIQVHPDDAYAQEHEGEMGKTEAWYIIEAEEGAVLVVGTKDCTKEQFAQAIQQGNLESYLNVIPVKKGDFFFIQSGLVHAIGKGIVIAEIQQNSDTTYRVYDYNRGRELQIEKALDVIDFHLMGKKSVDRFVEENSQYRKTVKCTCDKFIIEQYDVYTSCSEVSEQERFSIFTCTEGEGEIRYKEGTEMIRMGDSLLIPATLGSYTLVGEMKLLKTYIPL
ncbi:MAG: type I phosphomannose isomerase catalytic subunit [Bacillota bacterium]